MVPQWMIDQCQQQLVGHTVEGFVEGKGPRDAKIMFIGEAPGAKEVEKNEPFIGQAGQHLTQFLNKVGIERDDVYITSAFRSRPYKEKKKSFKSGEVRVSKSNRPPTQKELDAHAPILDYQIQSIRPQLIVTLGNIGLQRLVGKTYTVSNVHGQIIQKPIYEVTNPFEEKAEYVCTQDTYTIFPMYHPAAVIYRRQLQSVIDEDLNQLAAYLTSHITP